RRSTKESMSSAFSSLSAIERVHVLVDAGTFVPLADSDVGSPLLTGAASIGGAPVLLAFLDGHVRGGTIGVREAGELVRIAEAAASRAASASLLIGFDTGGVRVEEGPRALAAASAAGVALARSTLVGVRTAALISGRRGCFGAPAVMAALPERIFMTEGAHWGLTGPKLFGDIGDTSAPGHWLAGPRAATRFANGDAHEVVPDTAAAIRDRIRAALVGGLREFDVRSMSERLALSAQVTATLCERLRAAPAAVAPAALTPPRR